MIMVPVLILQIFLFPYVANVIMGAWENDRVDLQLEEIAANLGSSVQQLYYTMNRELISSGTLTIQLYTPSRIICSWGEYRGNYSYTITIRNVTVDADFPRAQIMNITVSLFEGEKQRTAFTLVTLGEIADWDDASYISDYVSVVKAARMPDSIWLSFEEG
jgi:hypothetical protein